MAGGPIVPGPQPPGRGRRSGPGGVELRLADLLASLSLVADLGFGLPPEQSMRSCLVSTALARRGAGLGLAQSALERLRIAGLLHDLGRVGVSNAAWERPGALTAAQWEGEDR